MMPKPVQKAQETDPKTAAKKTKKKMNNKEKMLLVKGPTLGQRVWFNDIKV